MPMNDSEQLEIRLGRQFGLLLYGILLLFAITLALVVGWGGKNNLKQNLIEEQKSINKLFQQELHQQVRTFSNSLKQFSSLPGTPQKISSLASGAWFAEHPEPGGARRDDDQAARLFENQVWFLDNALALAKQHELDYIGLYLLPPHTSMPNQPPALAAEINHGKLVLSHFAGRGEFGALAKYSYQTGQNKAEDSRVLRNISQLAAETGGFYGSTTPDRGHQALGLQRDNNVSGHQLDAKKSGTELLAVQNGVMLRVTQAVFSDVVVPGIASARNSRGETVPVALLVVEKELNTAVLKKMANNFGQELALLQNGRVISASLAELSGTSLPARQTISTRQRDYFAWSEPLKLDGVSAELAVAVLTGTGKLDALAATIYRYIAFSTIIVLLVISPFLHFILNRHTQKVHQRTTLLRQQNEKLDKLSLEAEAARQRLVDMTDRLPLTVVQFREAVNGERDFVFVGKNVYQVMGISTEELLSDKEARWRNVLDDDHVTTKSFVLEQLAQRRAIEFDHRIRVDGAIRWIYTHLIPTPLADGSWVWNGFYMDVTEARKQAEELRVAKEQAEQATQAKSAFLANMSHEIRTPMNAIMGLSRLAMKTALSAQQRDYLHKIFASSESLLHIINDILDFSKVEAGQLALEQIPFSINEMLNQVSATVTLKAHGKGLELLFDLDPAVPAMLVGDALRLGQIIVNLANNAIKFTERGEVVVRIDCESRPAQKLLLYITVSDSGVGIAQAQLATLFRPFTQADASTTRKYGGTGLGLAICKQLAELMQGQIWANSEPGVGSVFTFTAELGLCPDAAPALPDSPPLAQQRVLLVDDNLQARTILGKILRQLGARVEPAASGRQALRLLQNEPFELMLIDATMPHWSGLETLRQIQQQSIPLPSKVLLLANSDHWAELLGPAQQLGVLQVLSKPLLLPDLLQALQPNPLSSPPCTAPAQQDYARLRGARVLLVEDSPLNQQVALEFLLEVGIEADIAANGGEGVESILSRQYELVLMDIQMPEMDGFAATRQIRSHSRFATLPVIAMTAHAMSGDREQSLAAGMNDHVTKPIDPLVLYATLLRWLPQRVQPELPDAEAVSAPDSGAACAALPPGLQTLAAHGMDVVNGLARHLHRVAFYERVLQMFVQEYANLAEKMAPLLENGDAHNARRLMHNLKAAAGTIGAGQLAELAKALELQSEPVTAAALTPLLAELTRVVDLLRSVPETEAPTSTTAIADATITDLENGHSLSTLLHHLQPLLVDDDADALDLMASICRQHQSGEHGTALVSLNELIQQFSFEQALACLQDLLGKLSTGSVDT